MKKIKLADDVTREMLMDVVEQTLKDMEKEQKEARAAYKKDKKDEFHMYMDTMFGLAIDMLKDRVSTLCEEE